MRKERKKIKCKDIVLMYKRDGSLYKKSGNVIIFIIYERVIIGRKRREIQNIVRKNIYKKRWKENEQVQKDV